MKTAGTALLFIALALFLALGLNTWIGLGLTASLAVAGVAALLFYLMIDLRPEGEPGDGTITRLTRGNWRRKS